MNTPILIDGKSVAAAVLEECRAEAAKLLERGIRPGLASWFRRIIDASARANGIDPDAAVWR